MTEPPGEAELDKAVRQMAPQPSADTTPVEFSVGGVWYRMPRNYLITMESWNGGPQALVTVRVNISDLNPMTEKTRACFAAITTHRLPDCEPFEFRIEGRGMVSAGEALASARDLFHSQDPIDGPFGYEEYEVGPENARLEYYRKLENGRTLSVQVSDSLPQ